MLSTTVLNIVVTQVINNKSKTLFKKTETMSDEVKEVNGKVDFHVGIKVPGIFGQYSSLDIGIGLESAADINNFEQHVNKYLDKVLKFEQQIVNNILIASGQPTLFEEINEK